MEGVQSVPVVAGRRILFLDSLRAIAVLLVVWGHVMLVGINDPNTVHAWVPAVTAPIFGVEGVANNMHGQLGLVVALSTGVNPGGLGVALFFLISGFVIIRSVERISSAQFLLQRFFRIIPTCMAAVVFVAFVTWLVCKQAGLEHPNSLQSLWTSSFALNFYNGAFATIPVLWTLEVEIAFYLLVAVLAATPMGLTSRGLIATSVVCLLFVSLSASPAGLGLPPSVVRITQHWSTILVHISFMLVGSLIYRAYTAGNWARRLPLVVIAVLLYWVNLTVLISATANQGIGATLNDCMAALVIFVAGMLAGLEAGWLKPLRWIGSISYPLYLLHVPLAWMLLYAFARLGLGMNIAGLLSVSIIIFASWLMHRTIEMPSQNFGKRLAKLLPPRRVTAPAIASAESAVG